MLAICHLCQIQALPPSVPGGSARLTGTHVAGTGTEAASLRDGLCLLQKSYAFFGAVTVIGELAAAINFGGGMKTAVETVFRRDFTDIEKQAFTERRSVYCDA